MGESEIRAGSGRMFDAIAPRYDAMNRLLSLGIDQSWRRAAVRSAGLGPGSQVLDVATGTADLAILTAQMTPDARVTGVDPSGAMLEIGRKKVLARGLDARVELVTGDAEQLPFEADRFDASTIAFGIRNVPDRERGLAEMTRVTRPGGRVVVLELTEPPPGPLGALARVHVHTIVPALGAMLSGKAEYRYLSRSIAAFPPSETFIGMMDRAGLTAIVATPFMFGVATLFVGTKAS